MYAPLIPAVLVLALCAAFTPPALSARAEPVETAPAITQPAPESAIRAMVLALRQNRVLEIVKLSEHEAELRADYARDQAKYAAELKDPERADGMANQTDPELAQLWTQLQSKAGRSELENQWFELIQTMLPTVRAQWPMYLSMARSSLEAQSELPVDTRASLSELLLALDRYLLETDFSDHDKLHATLADLGALVEASGVANYDDLRSLGFDEMIALAQRGMATGKRITLRYGIDADAVLDSFEVQSTRSSPDRAQLRQSVKVLGVPVVWYQELAWDGKAWGEPKPSKEEQAAAEAAEAAEESAVKELLEESEATSETVPAPPSPSSKCASDPNLEAESGTEF